LEWRPDGIGQSGVHSHVQPAQRDGKLHPAVIILAGRLSWRRRPGRVTTIGSNGSTQAGYAAVSWNSAAPAPYGTAIFSYRQNGVTVSEAGVPASPPITSARIFVDYRTGVSIPGSAGTVDTYTGFAAVNRDNSMANIFCTLRNLNGDPIASGTGSLGARLRCRSVAQSRPNSSASELEVAEATQSPNSKRASWASVAEVIVQPCRFPGQQAY
jgi:hypothetical protein